MPDVQLPEGQYFSLSGMITAGTGGQTRALLMRNRLLAQRAGIAPTLLTFDSVQHYPRIRAALRENGQLVDPMRLLNIFEWFRENDVDHLPTTGDPLPEIDGFDRVDDTHPDGGVYRTRYVHRHRLEDVAHDYRRADGSVYLRVPAGQYTDTSSSPTVLMNSQGYPVGSWPTEGGWRRHWITSLAEPGRRVFIISDSRFAVQNIMPTPDGPFHVVHLMHNLHLLGAQRWNATVKSTYLPLLENIGQLDGLVTLTVRQQDDVAARYGATTNLYVVPNPVELPARPVPMPARERRRFVVLARLERQKRLDDAVRAFALVLREEPDATLDIYGDGSARDALEKEIAALGVQDSVILRGHDSRARETLWSATGFLMTSRFEGYPLATLESMSHGCPVIGYDIKYGPREQITHGVDGYLVDAGDTQGLANRVVELIRNPELVATMSEAAFGKASEHDHAAFLEDWRATLEGVVAAKERRTALESVTLKVTRLGYARRLRLGDRFAGVPVIGRLARTHAASGAFRGPRTVEFKGRLEVDGRSPRSTPERAVVTLEAVDDQSGSIAVLPLDVRRSGTTFRLSATVDLGDVFRDLDDATRSVRLRLRLVWENSCWETTLSRPRRMEPNYEVSFSGTGTISLNRGRAAPRGGSPAR